jgi:glycosyltransferase involved in cell wall biosynthesis
VPLRLPAPPARPAPGPAAGPGPVVLFLPAHDEEATVAAVVARVPDRVLGRPVECLVVDDGSGDRTAVLAAAAGAVVLGTGANRGLGAAVRAGLAAALRRGAAAVAFCDADGEYDPRELERLVAPILEGRADYVVGSRFAGRIHRMLPHRRVGNRLLTRLLGWVARAPIGDGQSGFRALSRAAAADAEVVHDYNYAQVLTLDLLAKGYRYVEVPIGYRFRTVGRSFVRPLTYLRRVAPAVWRELHQPAGLAPADVDAVPGRGSDRAVRPLVPARLDEAGAPRSP